MNWWKKANHRFAGVPEVILLRYGPEGMYLLIDNIRYRCPGFVPGVKARMDALIRARAWGKAKQLCRSINCVNEEKEKQQDSQLTLF